jgi:hypothetical protein
LPDDRAPISEGPFSPTSAQGAADVVQTYYALIEGRRFDDAARLWWDRNRPSGMNPKHFVREFGSYREYRAQVGAPGRVSGAAGSAYVEVPVSIAARPRKGADQHFAATVLLRRVNGVSGAGRQARRWRIVRIERGRHAC